MNHNFFIDRLRGLSVLAVMCLHYQFYFKGGPAFLLSTLRNGYYGVTAFFCISGFLITANLLKRYGEVSRTSLHAFYVMRFSRIAPSLVLLLVVLSMLSMTAIPEFHFSAPLSLRDALLYTITFRFNHYYLLGASRLPVWAVLWSLSIEEMFYLGYPLVAKVTRRSAWLVVVLIEIIAYAPLDRLRGTGAMYGDFGCFDGIALGALSALAARSFGGETPRWASWMIMATGGALAAGTYAALDVRFHYVYGLTLVAVGVACMLFASQCPNFVAARPWRFDPLAYVGRLSYEIYLAHLTISTLLGKATGPRFAGYPALTFATIMACVVAVSAVVHRFYAEPLNRWLRRRLLPAAVPRAAGAEEDRRPSAPFPFGRVRAAGAQFARLALVLALLAQVVYTIYQQPEVAPALRVFAIRYLGRPAGPPEIRIDNPQGADRDGDLVWYWIGPDATIELTSQEPPGGPVRQYFLLFDAGMGPANPDLARELELRADDGTKQRFSFVYSATVRFEAALRPGKNVYTLRVTTRSTEGAVHATADPRTLLVKMEHFALVPAGPPTAQ